MGLGGIPIGLVAVVLVSVLAGGALAQTSSCTNAIMSLAPCLNYIRGNSSNPSPSCCSQLASVVQTSPQCLCQVLNGNNASLNQTMVLSLPGACKVRTPPISKCKALPPVTSSISSPREISPAVSPAPAISGSPTETSNETPEPTTIITPSASHVPFTSGAGSKTVPSTAATSSGSIVKAPLHFLLFVFFVAAGGSCVTKFQAQVFQSDLSPIRTVMLLDWLMGGNGAFICL